MPVPIVCAVSGQQSETTIYAGGEGIWSFVSHRSGGAFRSDDDGSSWVVAQNGIDLAPDGAVRALAIDPSAPSVLYAGTSSGSVYKTTDSGENWTPSSSGLPSEMISALVVDPSDSSVVYAGTSGGVFRSTDGGASWLSIGAIGNVTALALDPSNHSTLYALANQALLSITFAPSPCNGGPTTLCLHDGRFRVDVAWSSSSLRQAGAGRAIPLTSDTGAFWFFQPSNPEVVVKVIDGNRINGKFWVFYGALSDVEYAITVTDTRTGLSRGYRNPEGRLASAADTEAFDASEGASIATPDGAVALDEASACGGSPGALCLGAGRFRVEVAWTAEPFGDGVGKAVPLTRDSGAFWFFQPTNLELLMKVLDGRQINGKFWVFFGALSNVEYTVTVTDTESGEVKRYHNDQGTFASMADTAAFSGSSSTSPPGPASIVAGRWKGTLSGSSPQCPDFRVDAAAQFSQDGSRVTGAISTNRPCGLGGVFFGGIEGRRLTLRSTGGEMFDGRATNNHIEGTIGFPYDFLTHYGRLILDRTGP